MNAKKSRSIRAVTMKTHHDPEKKSASLTEQVYQELRTSIIKGKIRSGTRLVETTLASQMNVSRTPVREALQKLTLEGFLYTIPRAGYIVEEMSDHDIQDLFATRTAIEQLAARWALERITPDELEALRMNLGMSDEVIKSGVMEKMTELDMEFHRIIYVASRSKSLYRICQNLSDHTLKYRIALIHIPEMAKKTRADHHEIFKALLSKDPARLDRSIESHLRQARENIIALMERLRQEAFVSRDAAL